jgi:hypothetical protein
MKKQILNIGKALSRVEQKQVFGGNLQHEGGDNGGNCKVCSTNSDCASGVCMSVSGPDCGHYSCGCGKHCL